MTDERPAQRHRARFEREAQALAALNHPNIAALVGVEDSPALAIVMELIEGESLAARLAARAAHARRAGPALRPRRPRAGRRRL